MASELRELIDTLWNVNISMQPTGAVFVWELIDTLWNVNEYVARLLYTLLGN